MKNQTNNTVPPVPLSRLVRWLLVMLPDWQWKRELCGGVWIYYQTSLPMAPVWVQTTDGKSSPPRQSCELVRLKTERYRHVRYVLYPPNAIAVAPPTQDSNEETK